MPVNRRLSERLLLSTPIRYQQKGSQNFSNSLCRDISDSGIGFISEEFFPVSTQLVFETKHPLSHDFIKAAGEVVWVTRHPHSERFSVGAKFLGPPLPIYQ